MIKTNHKTKLNSQINDVGSSFPLLPQFLAHFSSVGVIRNMRLQTRTDWELFIVRYKGINRKQVNAQVLKLSPVSHVLPIENVVLGLKHDFIHFIHFSCESLSDNMELHAHKHTHTMWNWLAWLFRWFHFGITKATTKVTDNTKDLVYTIHKKNV